MLFSFVTVASVLSVVSAQAVYYPFDTDNVDLGTKQIWCTNQIASCTPLCLDQSSGGPLINTCDPDTLTYSCTCQDGTIPNATDYSQTIPYFICTYEVQACIANCGNGAQDCVEACKTDKVCGATNPTRVNSTETATTTTAEATPTSTNGDDDQAFDGLATTTGGGASATATDDDDAPAQTSSSSSNTKTSAGNRVELRDGAIAFSVMLLSVMCGAFAFQI